MVNGETKAKNNPEPVAIIDAEFMNIARRDADKLNLVERCGMAYNNTYTLGIDPEAVPGMLEALRLISKGKVPEVTGGLNPYKPELDLFKLKDMAKQALIKAKKNKKNLDNKN